MGEAGAEIGVVAMPQELRGEVCEGEGGHATWGFKSVEIEAEVGRHVMADRRALSTWGSNDETETADFE